MNNPKFRIQNLELSDRILVLDGAMGSLIQGYHLSEEDFRGERFKDFDVALKGCNDLLCLTRPDIIAEIHRKYLAAGADIITTNSFNANSVSLSDYHLEDYSYDIARASAQIARREVDDFMTLNPSRRRYVSGSVGPTNRTASIATDMGDPSHREISFDTLRNAYRIQIEGLIGGGVDIIQLETFFDTLNAKAAIAAAEDVFETLGRKLPIIVSGTLTPSGRTLSGQSIEAFYESIKHAEPLAVSLNCSFGARQLLPYLERLAAVAETGICVYPNAGLPNAEGEYDQTADMMARDVEEYLRRGLVNIVGGCCGTTPAHIGAIAQKVQNYRPRAIPAPKHVATFTGLETLSIDNFQFSTFNFQLINIGERTNVAGSAKFARLIREKNYTEALSVARTQIEAGAQIIDICFDAPMMDAVSEMQTFVNMATAEPDIARVPIMLDSSSWEVLETGLKLTQGRSIVNSISLKNGETEFLERAHTIYRYGGAAVVMLFDERGQADSYERKIEIAERAYKLLTESGFPAENIIFDPNVLATSTGIEASDRYALDFIEACRWIRENCANVNISGGVSNLSFAFRGNDKVRRALHSVFLHYAIEAGMTMAIVNPAALDTYEQIEPLLLELATDVVLARRNDATERLTQYAERTKEQKAGTTIERQQLQWRTEPVGERIRMAMMRGMDDYIETDALEAYNSEGSALEVIDRLFMPAMEAVGEAFSNGEMFLPQVVKSARVMKRGVAALIPYMEHRQKNIQPRRVVLATVKGDVHDIGKNIVSVVLSCNGYEIDDIGVMAERADIVAHARKADVLGLSALITPSLEEIIAVVRELEKEGIRIPVIVGGATTSSVHTAVKIAPQYSGIVIYSRDASENATIIGRLFGTGANEYEAEIRHQQATIRELYASQNRTLRPLADARSHRYIKPMTAPKPHFVGRKIFNNYPICEVTKYIDWRFFLASWKVKEGTQEANELIGEAKALIERIEKHDLLTLKGVVGIFEATKTDDDIIIGDTKIACLRNQALDKTENLSIVDFIAEKEDYICIFALSGGFSLKEMTEKLQENGDEYSAIMTKLVADRLTEAFAESLHTIVRRELWGYGADEDMSAEDILAEKYRGRRLAFGYAACPDHSLKREVFELLDVEQSIGLNLNENYMISPAESLCGIILPDAHYFDVGKIDRGQLIDYAHRRGFTEDQMRALLPLNI